MRSNNLLNNNSLLINRLVIIFIALFMVIFFSIIPTNYHPEKWMTYRNFDVPNQKNFINYMLPGVKDSSSNLKYTFTKIHYGLLFAVLFGFFPLMLVLRIIFDLDFKLKVFRFITQWLTFVVARLGIFRVTGACPIKRTGLGVFPFINCQSCELATGACPVGTFQMSLLNHQIPYVLIGELILVGIISGRWVCGWLCPFGFLSDIFEKIKAGRVKLNNKFAILKYFILALIILSGIYYFFNKSIKYLIYCSFICPAGFYYGVLEYTLTTGLKAMTKNFPFLHFMLVFHFITGALFLFGAAKFGGRFFCKFLCPVGAVLGFFNKIAIYKVEVNNNKCNGCLACKRVCPMDISILDKSFLSKSNCISCGRCIKVCPSKKLEYSINIGGLNKNTTQVNPIVNKSKAGSKNFSYIKN